MYQYSSSLRNNVDNRDDSKDIFMSRVAHKLLPCEKVVVPHICVVVHGIHFERMTDRGNREKLT